MGLASSGTGLQRRRRRRTGTGATPRGELRRSNKPPNNAGPNEQGVDDVEALLGKPNMKAAIGIGRTLGAESVPPQQRHDGR